MTQVYATLPKIEQSVKLYFYFGFTCTEDTWLYWRHKHSTGICPFCDAKLSRAYGNDRKHISTCLKRSKLPTVTLAIEQVVTYRKQSSR